MKCPRCETTSLDERDRDGITVDACAGCRGIWLDRGELEKLIARAVQDLEELAPPPARRDGERAGRAEHYGAPRFEHDRDDDRDYDRRHRKRKRSWVESLGDLFD
jgi:Zn-finger nucleic acid-binding protein